MALTPGVRLVAIGSPLVVVDDDTAAVAALLADGGIGLESRTVVDEDEAALERALTPPAPLTVLVTGPGGSAGDIARRVLARVTGARLVLSERMLAALEAPHRRVDRPLPRRDERLALLPQGAIVWARADGEPAWAFESDAGAWVVLPRGGLGPDLSARLLDLAHTRLDRGTCLAVRTLRTTGVTLGDVEERLAPWLGRGDGGSEIVVTMAPGDGEVWVRLRARGASTEAAAATLATLESPIIEALGEDCYGRDGESLEQVVGHRLTARGLTLATAESCTGGLVGARLTSVPGSSDVFVGGVVAYANRVKESELGVASGTLAEHGSVSAETAAEMASGVRARLGANVGIAVTGIAGPGGGTAEKPVGLVYLHAETPEGGRGMEFSFPSDRETIRSRATVAALHLVRRVLSQNGDEGV
jgi:nicotinamide-nucleotide amidase